MTDTDEVFTASNGIQVRVSPDAAKRVQYKGTHSSEWGNVGRFSGGYSFGSDLGLALSEFYRHREDVRLGRIRSEVDSDYVIYVDDEDPEGAGIRVVGEKTGKSFTYYRSIMVEEDASSPYVTYRRVAGAYFEANPPAPVLPTEPGLYVNSKAFGYSKTSVVILALGAGGGWSRKDNGESTSSEEAKEFATFWAKNGELIRLTAEEN